VNRIAIIGAGPAGSVAAFILARAGREVTLVEQHRFPRDKVCGECLSALGLRVLREIGLFNTLHGSLTPTELRRTILHPRCGDSIEIPLPAPMWGVSRAALDTALLRRAVDAGARLCQPARCERLAPNARGTDLILRDLATGAVRSEHAELTILADGKAALLPARPAATADLGLKSHFANVHAPADAIELFGTDGSYGGLAPVYDGRFNASFAVPTARVRTFNGNLEALFASICRENDALRRRMRHAVRVGAWHASPLPRFGVRGDWPDGVIPVGNAAAALEPIGGEGMGLAMRSAHLAAEAILSAGEGPIDTARLRQAYRSLWSTRRIACRAAAMAMSRPELASAALALADVAPRVSGWAMRLIGK
jgi:flavin-dependent dehydrogenase